MKNSRLFLIAGTMSTILVTTGCGGSTSSPQPHRVVTSLLDMRRDKVIKQSWDISCGSAALATVLTYDENYPVTERDVAAELLKKTSVQKVREQLGFSLLDLKNFVQNHGFEAAGLGNVSLPDLVSIGPAILPVVVHGYNHFVVFRGIEGDRVLLADPAWGNRTMRLDNFLDMWKSRIAFTIQRSNSVNGSPIKVTFHPITPHSRDFIASSDIYERRDIVKEALQPEPDVKVASTAQPQLSEVVAGTDGSRATSQVIENAQREIKNIGIELSKRIAALEMGGRRSEEITKRIAALEFEHLKVAKGIIALEIERRGVANENDAKRR